MLEQIAARLGKGLFAVCTAAGYALADAIDKGIDKVCENMEKDKGGES